MSETVTTTLKDPSTAQVVAAAGPKHPPLRARAMRGMVWAFSSYGVNQFLRLASNLVLSRLLAPKAFGLMALVAVFLSGLQMFSDVGIRPSIIQNRRGDEPDFLNTAWTIQVIRGTALWLLSCLIAWPAAMI